MINIIMNVLNGESLIKFLWVVFVLSFIYIKSKYTIKEMFGAIIQKLVLVLKLVFKLKLLMHNLFLGKVYILKFGEFLFWRSYGFLGRVRFYNRLHLWFEWLIYRYGLYYTNYLYLVLRFMLFVSCSLCLLFFLNFFILELNEYIVSWVGVLVASYVLFALLVLYMLLFSFMLRSFLLEFYSIILFFTAFFVALLYIGDYYYWDFGERDIFADIEDYVIDSGYTPIGRYRAKVAEIGPNVKYADNPEGFKYQLEDASFRRDLYKRYNFSKKYRHTTWRWHPRRKKKFLQVLKKMRIDLSVFKFRMPSKKLFKYKFQNDLYRSFYKHTAPYTLPYLAPYEARAYNLLVKYDLLGWRSMYGNRDFLLKRPNLVPPFRYFFYNFLVFFGFDDYDPFSKKFRFGYIDTRYQENMLLFHGIWDDGDYWNFQHYIYGIDEKGEGYPELHTEDEVPYSMTAFSNNRLLGSLFISDQYILDPYRHTNSLFDGFQLYKWPRSISYTQFADFSNTDKYHRKSFKSKRPYFGMNDKRFIDYFHTDHKLRKIRKYRKFKRLDLYFGHLRRHITTWGLYNIPYEFYVHTFYNANPIYKMHYDYLKPNAIFQENVLSYCLNASRMVDLGFDLSKMSYTDARRIIKFDSDLRFITDAEFGNDLMGSWTNIHARRLNESNDISFPSEMLIDKYDYQAEKQRIAKTLWHKSRTYIINFRRWRLRFRFRKYKTVKMRNAYGMISPIHNTGLRYDYAVNREPDATGARLPVAMLYDSRYQGSSNGYISFLVKQYIKSFTYLNADTRLGTQSAFTTFIPFFWSEKHRFASTRMNFRIGYDWYYHYYALTEFVDFRPEISFQKYMNYGYITTSFNKAGERKLFASEDDSFATYHEDFPYLRPTTILSLYLKKTNAVSRYWMYDAIFDHLLKPLDLSELKRNPLFFGSYPESMFNIVSTYNIYRPSARIFGNLQTRNEIFDWFFDDPFFNMSYEDVGEGPEPGSRLVGEDNIGQGFGDLAGIEPIVWDYDNLFIYPVEEEFMLGSSIIWLVTYFILVWYIWTYMFIRIKNPLKMKLMKSNLLGLIPYLNVPINNIYMSELYDVRLFLRRLNWIMRNQPWKVEMFTRVMYADLLYIDEDYQDFSITGLDVLTTDIERLEGWDIIKTPIKSMDDKFDEHQFSEFGFKKFVWDLEWLQELHDDLYLLREDQEDDEGSDGDPVEGMDDGENIDYEEEPFEDEFSVNDLIRVFGSSEHDEMTDFNLGFSFEEQENLFLQTEYQDNWWSSWEKQHDFLESYNYNVGGELLTGIRNKFGYYSEEVYEGSGMKETEDNESELEKVNEEALLNYYYHRYKILLVRSFFLIHSDKKVGSNYKYYLNLYLYKEKKENSLVFTKLYKDFESDLLWFFPMFFDGREMDFWFSSDFLMEGVELSSDESGFVFDDDIVEIDGGDWTYNIEIERLLLKEWATCLGLSVNNYLFWKQSFNVYLNTVKRISVLELWEVECNSKLNSMVRLEGFKVCDILSFLKMEYYVNVHLGIFFVVYNKGDLLDMESTTIEDKILYKREVLVNGNIGNYIKDCDYDFVFENYIESWGDYWFFGLNQIYFKAMQNIYRLHYFNFNGTLFDLYSLSSNMFYDSYTGELFLWFPFADVLGIITYKEIMLGDMHGVNSMELAEMEPKYIYSSYDFYKNKVRDYYKVLSNFIVNRVSRTKTFETENLVDVLLEGYSANKLLGNNYEEVKHIMQILLSIHWRYHLEPLKVQPLWDRLNQNVIYGDLRRGEFFPGYLSDTFYTTMFWYPSKTPYLNKKYPGLRNYNLMKNRRDLGLKYSFGRELYDVLNRKEFSFLIGNEKDLFLYDFSKLVGSNNLVKVVDNILAFFVLEEEIAFCKLVEVFNSNLQYGILLITDMFFSVVKECDFDSLVKICFGLVLKDSEALVLQNYLNKFEVKIFSRRVLFRHRSYLWRRRVLRKRNFDRVWRDFENYKHKLNNVFFFSIFSKNNYEFFKIEADKSYFDFAGADVRYRLPYKVPETMFGREINESDYDMFEYLSNSKLHVVPCLDFYFEQRFTETGFLRAELNNYVLYEPLELHAEGDYFYEGDVNSYTEEVVDVENDDEWLEFGDGKDEVDDIRTSD